MDERGTLNSPHLNLFTTMSKNSTFKISTEKKLMKYSWPITKLELHKKEPTKLELQKNELTKLELHKLEPMQKRTLWFWEW